MVALVVGGECRLINEVIAKLNKGGHRVYLLTGRRDNKLSYPRVFEKYCFPYDSDSVKNIFESTDPDVVICMGAFDTNYDWSNARRESVRYTADLMNLLSTYSLKKKGRLIYLSSEEVFGESHIDNITEEEPVSAGNFRAIALSQGEDICRRYHDASGMDTVVLRMDHLYGLPQKGKLEKNPVFELCLEGLKTNNVSGSGKKEFSMLYSSDAVEYLYQVMMADTHKYTLYHISAMKPVTELFVARLVKGELGQGVTLTDNTVGQGFRCVLDSTRFQEEFGQEVFVHYKAGIREVVKYMKKNSESYLSLKDTGAGTGGRLKHMLWSIFHKLVPFIENMVCFIPFFMLNNRATGSEYFGRLDFYLLYVLLFAILYGQQQAIFSALLAIGGHLFRQMYDQTGFEVLLDYKTYIWMAQLFILGMVVGYMKDQLFHVRNQDEEEIRYLNGQLTDIEDINDSNVRLKECFEKQVVNQKDSLGKIYEITASVDQHGPEEVLFYAAEMLSKLMDSRDVAVYTVANKDYARLFSFTSKKARKMGNSIKYTDLTEMYEELKEHRVYINKTMKEEYPLMANGIFEGESLQIIMMVWNIPWERMNLAEANRLTVAGFLVQTAMVRANRYLEALQNQRYVQGTCILDSKVFSALASAFLTAKAKNLTECTLLEVVVTDEGDMQKVAECLNRLIRQSDYIGRLEDKNLYVLLSNTDNVNATYVINRLREAGYTSYIKEGDIKEA